MDFEDEPAWKFLRPNRETALKEQSKPFDAKKNCWVPDPDEGYIAAEITKSDGDTITVVTCRGNQINLKYELVQEMNPPKFEKTEDMSNLTFLNDASVLHNLRARYSQMLIYTYSGLFCVVVNPYKCLPIYAESVAALYMGKRRTEMPPHLFAVSDEAYRSMLRDQENQSILITGESGAGKTENTKKVIAYFAAVGAKQSAAEPPSCQRAVTLEDQIVQTNPVLEAFGNAKTVRNNNSSRFGKFIRIHFSKLGRVASCNIEHYLLEKSRVIRQAPGERCYHIFYQICSGHSATLMAELLLDRPLAEYAFVAQAELSIDGVDDKDEFQATDEAFDILSFSRAEKRDCYRLVSALMHMGCMRFKQRAREEQAETDGRDEAEKAACMLGVEVDDFLKAILKPKVKVGLDFVTKGQNLEQVTWSIGSVAKGLYSRVFNWLVQKCNVTLDQQGVSRDYFIGVLDIAGFEIFDFNSFEQLWINFVNEKLQQFFNHHMFVLEQEEYAREGIQWTFIDFGLDLQACIELIEKPMGIISMLDEECIVPKATDLTLAQKLSDQHLDKHPNFEKPKPPKGKQSEAHFAMRHYAGTVRYNVMNWLEKNKDPLNDTVISVLKQSKKNSLLPEIWKEYKTQEEIAAPVTKKKGKTGSMMTVSMLYRESLGNLMAMLNTTHPHFIRCIIPNEKKQSGVLDAALVLNQLTCNGVLEGIRICRKGFPNRMSHADFTQRYTILDAGNLEEMLCTLTKMGHLHDEQYRVGKTKVFFKAGVLAHLENLRDEKLRAVFTNFQAVIRTYLAQADRSRRMSQRAGLLIVQRNVKSWSGLRTWPWFRLYSRVRPLLRQSKVNEEMERLASRLQQLETALRREKRRAAEFAAESERVAREKTSLLHALEDAHCSAEAARARLHQLEHARAEAEHKVHRLSEQVYDLEEDTDAASRQKRDYEAELESVRKQLQQLDLVIRKSDSERVTKDYQLRSLTEELQQQDAVIAKLTKERKQLEEENDKLQDAIRTESEKSSHQCRTKCKLEQTLRELEDALERERRGRADAEKQRRKLEGETRICGETIDDGLRQQQELEQRLRRGEQELQAGAGRLADETSLRERLEKQLKETAARLAELQEEAELERQTRTRLDRARGDLQADLAELSGRLEQEGDCAALHADANRRREAEAARLRREIEDAGAQREAQIAAARRKMLDAEAQLRAHAAAARLATQRLEREREEGARAALELRAALEQQRAARLDREATWRRLEAQAAHAHTHLAEQQSELAALADAAQRLQTAHCELQQRLTAAQTDAAQAERLRLAAQNECDVARSAAEEEAVQRSVAAAHAKTTQTLMEQLREQLDEEREGRAEAGRQAARAACELQAWRGRLETEGHLRREQVEEAKRRLQLKAQELEDAVEAGSARIAVLERQRARLAAELDDAQVDVERATNTAATLEQRHRGHDGLVDELRKNCEELEAEIERTRREARDTTTELFHAKAVQDELVEATEALQKESRALGGEVRELSEQLGEGGRSLHGVQKTIRRLEAEKEEARAALEQAEGALEAAEAKALAAQHDVAFVRAEIEKRVKEKDDDLENTRRNQQRALDSLLASVEVETRARAELLKAKKKAEDELNSLEIQLDHVNKSSADLGKALKRAGEQLRDAQLQHAEELRGRDELRDQLQATQKRVSVLRAENDELIAVNQAAQKERHEAEAEAAEAREEANALAADIQSLSSQKRRLEGDLQALQIDLDETLSQLKAIDEKAKKAVADTSRYTEELAAEQEKARQLEASRVRLLEQLKDFQAKLDAAEGESLRTGKKAIARLERRVHELEADLELEQRRVNDSVQKQARTERRVRELQFQVEEDKKNFERLNALVDQLQTKIRSQKRQLEDVEELANTNMQKFRAIQAQLEEAEDRVDMAEQALAKLRAKTRAGTSAPRHAPLQTSATVAAFPRKPSYD